MSRSSFPKHTVLTGAALALSLLAANSFAEVRLWSSDALSDGNLGGRTGADALCDADVNKPEIPDSTTRAFISVGDSDEIRDMPMLYDIPTDEVIYRADGVVQIAANWDSLLSAGSTPLDNSVDGVLDTILWTGSTGVGASNADCSHWTSASGAIMGRQGQSGTTDAFYLDDSGVACSSVKALYCITYTAPESAADVQLDGTTATGITGLEVNLDGGTETYDVTFVSTSAEALYGNPPSSTFPFSLEDSTIVNDAILSALNGSAAITVGPASDNSDLFYQFMYFSQEDDRNNVTFLGHAGIYSFNAGDWVDDSPKAVGDTSVLVYADFAPSDGGEPPPDPPVSRTVSFANPASNLDQQTFLRFVNKASESNSVEVSAIDDPGLAAPGGILTFTLSPFQALQLTAQDLEEGNIDKGVNGALGDGTGKWRLTVAATQEIEVLSMIRTPDGFLTGVNAQAPVESDLVNVYFANPAENPNQESFLRFINDSESSALIDVEAFDDPGNPAPGTSLQISLEAEQSQQFTATDLEAGNADKGMSGALGNGQGKWRLIVDPNGSDLTVQSLIRTPDGFLTNVSAVTPKDGNGDDRIYFANPASETTQSTFIRVINPSDSAGSVTISGIDDNGDPAPGGVVTFDLAAGESKQMTGMDLEAGNAGKGLSGALGDGEGRWQLTVSSATLDLVVQGLIRTPDGFVTNLSEIAPRTDATTTIVDMFNPGSNQDQVSSLRIVNRDNDSGEVTITGIDDAGNASGTATITIGANAGVLLSAADLENGNANAGISGGLGDGEGKWSLTVTSDLDIAVMSVLETPTGFITNLSRPVPGQ